MNQYQTTNQIAEDLRKDPRQVALELHRAGVQPEAELVSETGKRKSQPLWNRADAIKALAKGLKEAVERANNRTK